MKNQELLTRPFSHEQIRERPGQQGRVLRYVDIAAVIERLNEVFEHEWSFEIVEHRVQDGEAIVLGRLSAGGITKAAFGGSGVTTDRVGNVVSIADDLKAAASDSIKKCASMFGIALDLYGGHRESVAGPSRPEPAESRSRPMMPQERITARQLGALTAAGRDHGLTRGDLEALVADRTGKRGLSDLTRLEGSALIDELRGTGGTNTGRA